MDLENGIFLRRSTLCQDGCSFASHSGIFQLIIPQEVLGDDYDNRIQYSIKSEASTLCPGTRLQCTSLSLFIICAPSYRHARQSRHARLHTLWVYGCVGVRVCPSVRKMNALVDVHQTCRHGATTIKFWYWSDFGCGSSMTFPLFLTLRDRAFYDILQRWIFLQLRGAGILFRSRTAFNCTQLQTSSNLPYPILVSDYDNEAPVPLTALLWRHCNNGRDVNNSTLVLHYHKWKWLGLIYKLTQLSCIHPSWRTVSSNSEFI